MPSIHCTTRAARRQPVVVQGRLLAIAFSVLLVSAARGDTGVTLRIEDRTAVSGGTARPGKRAGAYRQVAHDPRPMVVPQRVAWWARPSLGPGYGAYYVGGGATSFYGRPRRADEGTFGMDYLGTWFQRRVWQHWWHRPHAQGGRGAYATDH